MNRNCHFLAKHNVLKQSCSAFEPCCQPYISCFKIVPSPFCQVAYCADQLFTSTSLPAILFHISGQKMQIGISALIGSPLPDLNPHIICFCKYDREKTAVRSSKENVLLMRQGIVD